MNTANYNAQTASVNPLKQQYDAQKYDTDYSGLGYSFDAPKTSQYTDLSGGQIADTKSKIQNLSGLGGDYTEMSAQRVRNIGERIGGMDTGIKKSRETELAEQQLRGTLTGRDAVSQSEIARQQEQTAAREAATRGLMSQREARAGLSPAMAGVARRMDERQLTTDRLASEAQLSSQILGRADQATAQLAEMGGAEEARKLKETQLAMDAATGEAQMEQFAAEFGLDVERAKDAKDQWQQEFGLKKIMSESELDRWASELGLSIEQARDMQNRWTQELKMKQQQLNNEVEMFKVGTDLEKQQLQNQADQWAAEMGYNQKVYNAELGKWEKEYSQEERFFAYKADQWMDEFGLSAKEVEAKIEQMVLDGELKQQEADIMASEANKKAYRDYLDIADFSTDDAIKQAQALYAEAYPGAGTPSFDELRDEAWDRKEGKAGQDLVTYITNMGFDADDFATGSTAVAAVGDNDALKRKVLDLYNAQFMKNTNDLGEVPEQWLSDTLTRMALSPDQQAREQELADYETALIASGMDSTELSERLEDYQTMQMLRYNDGMQTGQVGDINVMRDASGNIIWADGDAFTMQQVIDGSQVYMTDSGRIFVDGVEYDRDSLESAEGVSDTVKDAFGIETAEESALYGTIESADDVIRTLGSGEYDLNQVKSYIVDNYETMTTSERQAIFSDQAIIDSYDSFSTSRSGDGKSRDTRKSFTDDGLRDLQTGDFFTKDGVVYEVVQPVETGANKKTGRSGNNWRWYETFEYKRADGTGDNIRVKAM